MITKNECIEGFFKRIIGYSSTDKLLYSQLRVDLEKIYEYGKIQAEKELIERTQEWWEEQNADKEWLDAHGEGNIK